MSARICAGSHLCKAAGTNFFCQLLMVAFRPDFGEYSWDWTALFGKKSNVNFQTPLYAIRTLHHLVHIYTRVRANAHIHTHVQTRVSLNTHRHMLYSQQWLSRGMNDQLILNYASRPRLLWWGLNVRAGVEKEGVAC